MGFDIQWGLLGRPVDVGGAFNAGLETARARRRELAQENALAAYAQNPQDPSALNALTAVDPRLGIQLQSLQRQDAERARLAAKQKQEQDLEGVKFGARLLEGVNTPEAYAAARQAYARAGFDVSEVPEQFDPSYIAQVIQAGKALEKPNSVQPPNIQREAEYYRSIGKPQLAEQLLARHAEGPPIVANNGDGTFTIIPPNVARGAMAGTSPPQGAGERVDEATLRSQAAEAIRKGADPAAVNARLQQMLKGGAGSQVAPRPFP